MNPQLFLVAVCMNFTRILFFTFCFTFPSEVIHANPTKDALRGFEFLVHGEYGSPGLTDDIFDNLWMVWDGNDGIVAPNATPEQRRAMTLHRYGLYEAPYENNGLPMGYTRGRDGVWRSNCLVCHGGSVNNKPVIGAPNYQLNLATLNEDILKLLKLFNSSPDVDKHAPSRMSTGIGTTNAVVFSHELLQLRDIHLDLIDIPFDLGPIIDHDLDAPPWWHVKNKSHFYSDAFVQKNPRALMQFAMVPENSGEALRSMLSDFEHMLQYLETIEAPKYPWAIDSEMANTGSKIFHMRCAFCHGTDGSSSRFSNRLIPYDVVKTDPVRLFGLTREFRHYYALSWLSDYGQLEVNLEGQGYVAPPLSGIWASAPYFHNGSVPTLWDVLNPDDRPVVWKVFNYNDYDHFKMGLKVDRFAEMPSGILINSERRRFYDTNGFGKSNRGHPFAQGLSETDKRALLEFLKTL